MKKHIINTGKLLLAIATLVIVLHLLIPHDHHQESLCLHSENTMPGHESHSGFPVFPSHCHAFNDLDSHNRHVYVLRMMPEISIPAIFEGNISLELNFYDKTVFLKKEPNKTICFFSSSWSLRAPPSIS